MKQSVIVAGAGISGIGAASMLLSLGEEVILYDGNQNLDKEALLAKFEAAKPVILLGELKKEDLAGVKLCVISPGIPLDVPFMDQVRACEIPVWGELQLAYHYAKGRLAAITGTNGKTTTTALVGQMAKDYYKSVFVVGNIGAAYTDSALKTTGESVTVAEVSSFQLETITDFKPNISAILNITPDHLNRHKTMENYIAVKESIAKNQDETDCCVLNYDDAQLRKFGESLIHKSEHSEGGLPPKVIFFSRQTKLENGLCMEGDSILLIKNGKQEEVCTTDQLNLFGGHNYENIMAAVAVGLELGIPMDSIRKTLKAFQAVEHRIEFVANKHGVAYFNDSKGTNPDAAIQGIRAMTRPTLLIAGGYDKDAEYDEWIRAFDGKVKYLVLIGQTRDKIAKTAKLYGVENIIYAEDMGEAVSVCAAYASNGDAVLLSPACASWGMFKDYEERGRIFKDCVSRL